MRKSAKALGLVVVSFLAAIVMAVGSAFAAALAFGATALIVPGTGTPDANIVAGYLQNATDRYVTPFNPACGATCDLNGINYPASFFPLVIFPGWCRSGPDGCDKWNDSVGKGTTGLTDALAPYLKLDSTEDVTLFGYSQGGAVVSNVLQNLGGLDQSVKDRLHVVTIGGIENPDGGLWSRLGFLPTIPFLDITFGPPMKTDTGIDTTAIGFQYDPVTYAPRYWGNPLALLNAVAALETVHGYYLSPNGNGPTDTLPYGYTPETLADQLNCTTNPGNCRYGQTVGTKNTYIMIPATSLPIFDLISGLLPAPLKPLVQPLINLLTPVTKVLVDLGYDFSGNPDTPTPLSILPFSPSTNPIKVAADLVAAVFQGIHDAINGAPTTLAPAITQTPISTLALRSIAPADNVADAPELAGNPASVTSLTASRKSASTLAEPAVTGGTDVVDATGDVKTTPIVEEATTPVVDVPVVKSDELTTAVVEKDVPKTDLPKTDAPKTDAPKKDADVKKDAPKKDADVKKDAPKKDADVKKDAPKKDADVKKDEPKKDADTKKAEPKSDAGDAGSKKDAA